MTGCSSTTHFLSVVKPSEVIPQPWLHFSRVCQPSSQAYYFIFEAMPKNRPVKQFPQNKSSPEKGSPALRLKLSYSSDSINFYLKQSANCGKNMDKSHIRTPSFPSKIILPFYAVYCTMY